MSPTPRPPNRDWTDERLDAAFRAWFGAATPAPDLPDRVHHALAGAGGPSVNPWLPWLARGAAPVLVAVALLVVGLGSLDIVRGPTATSTAAAGQTAQPGGTGAGSPAPVPTNAVDATIPTTITVPGTTEPQPVLTVAQAWDARLNGQVGRELVVGGWYVMTPVPCAQDPNPSSELEHCAVDFTVLQSGPSNPEAPSSPLPSSGWGPLVQFVQVINVVTAFTDWAPPPSDGRDHPIVVTGHFNDNRATGCPEGERRTRCERLFVIDAPLWTEAGFIDVAAAPDTAGKLAVRSVEDALAIRDSGSSDEIAVAGWFSAPVGVFSCPAEPVGGPTWLEGRCTSGMVWLMANPEGIITRVGEETRHRAPTGAAIQPAFPEGVPWPMGNGVPNQGSSIPMPAVLVGHFNDPRSSKCTGWSEQTPAEILAACRARFVVDLVTWANGTDRVPGI